MIAAVFLAATLNAPRACAPLMTWSAAAGAFAVQDDYALYLRDGDGSLFGISRVAKDGSGAQRIAATDRNIRAIDVDGPHVYFGTADTSNFPDFVYGVDQLRVVTIFGGEPAVLAGHTGRIFWVGHDATHVFWLEEQAPGDSRLRRVAKRDGSIETVAEHLRVRLTRAAAVGEENVFVITPDDVLAVSKDGSRPPDIFGSADSMFFHAGAVYFVWGGYGQIVRATEDRASFRLTPQNGFGEEVFGIAGDLFFYGTFGSPTERHIRHICSGRDEIPANDYGRNVGMLVDTCAMYTIDAHGNVTKSAGPGGLRIDAITPAHAKPGDLVTITGSGFERTSTLTFDGVEAVALLLDPDRMTAIVPPVPRSGGADIVAVHNVDGRCAGAFFAVADRE